MQAAVGAPRTIWVAGTVTVLPLALAALTFCYGPVRLSDEALSALITYATVLLSFLGGVRAGLEIERPNPRWSVLALSLLPPLAAWLLLLGGGRFEPAWQISGVLAAFLLQWLWDVTSHDGPDWRPRLRTFLTVFAAVSLGLALEQALHI